jgi:hypothetical protein
MSSEEQISALRSNIETKGKNSYYYAHGPKINGPKWDGKEEPKLLSTGDSEAPSSERLRLCKAFTEYAWADGKKLVTVYLDFEKAESVPDEIITVSTTSDSITFSIDNFEGKDYKLFIDNLSAEVSAARYKKKEGQFKILLTKLDESPWFKLKK